MTDTLPVAPFEIPTEPDQVLEEMRLRGLSFDDAQKVVQQRHDKKRADITAIFKDAANQIGGRQAAAAEAQRRADEEIERHISRMDEARGMLIRYADAKREVQEISALGFFAPNDEQTLGRALFQSFMQSRRAPCVQTQSAYLARLNDFTTKQAIGPFLAEGIIALEIAVKTQTREIAEFFKANGIDAAAFIQRLAKSGDQDFEESYRKGYFSEFLP